MKYEKKLIFVMIGTIMFGLFLQYIVNNISDITGAVTGVASVQVAGITSIILTTNNVNFGLVDPGGFYDTLDDFPFPFVIENTGNVPLNISIGRSENSTALFSGSGGGDNTLSFQFMPGIAENNAYDTVCSPSNWTNIPGTDPILAVCKLKHQNAKDSVQIELRIAVPLDEPVGTKSETLNFIGYQA